MNNTSKNDTMSFTIWIIIETRAAVAEKILKK